MPMPADCGHRFADEIILRLGGGIAGVAETKLYFVSNRSGSKEIWQMDYDGADQKQLTHMGSIALSPHVSPDGTRVAYSGVTKEGWQILKPLLELGRAVSFQHFGGDNYSPAWSSDRGLDILRVVGKPRQQREQQVERIAVALPQVHPPGQRLLVVDLVPANYGATLRGLRLGQAVRVRSQRLDKAGISLREPSARVATMVVGSSRGTLPRNSVSSSGKRRNWWEMPLPRKKPAYSSLRNRRFIGWVFGYRISVR